MRPSVSIRLHHVSLPIPSGAQDIGREFYGGIVGLREIPIPDSLKPLQVVWFAIGDGMTELHLLPDILPDPSANDHLGLVVPDLEELWHRLRSAQYEPYKPTPIPGRPRFYCRDPFNNLVEFLQIIGDYRTTEDRV
jgi:catechol 2,3-dioxygenase-like lactoylglutathione lyase family enzyme